MTVLPDWENLLLDSAGDLHFSVLPVLVGLVRLVGTQKHQTYFTSVGRWTPEALLPEMLRVVAKGMMPTTSWVSGIGLVTPILAQKELFLLVLHRCFFEF